MQLALTTAVDIVAAFVMGGAAWVLVRRSAPVQLWVVVLSGALAVIVTALLALVTGAEPVGTAASIATGAVPVAVLVAATNGVGAHPVRTTLLAASAWAVVVVPLAIVIPQALVRQCAAQGCTVEDFGGALPFVIGAGAFLLVPAAATADRIHLRSGTGAFGPDLAATLVLWGGFVVWLAALEGAVDRYVPGIALAAVGAPAAGAIGWVLVDRIRSVPTTVRRGLRLGLLAGMGGLLPGVISMATPWCVLVGLLAGAIGALVHDARGLTTTPVVTRVAVAAISVGVLGMIAPGILGRTLGFVFAARIDVLGTQILASVAVVVLAIAVSVPVALLTGSRGRAR